MEERVLRAAVDVGVTEACIAIPTEALRARFERVEDADTEAATDMETERVEDADTVAATDRETEDDAEALAFDRFRTEPEVGLVTGFLLRAPVAASAPL